MLLSLRDWRRRSSAEAALRADLRARMERLLGFGPDDHVSVAELGCADPGCPEVETVFLAMQDGRPTRAARRPVPMAEITDVDLLEAAEELRAAAAPAGEKRLPRSGPAR